MINKYKQFVEETGQLLRYVAWLRDKKIKQKLKGEGK